MSITYEAGKVVRLTADISVTIGALVTMTSHPSGTQFDGPAVIVAAYLSSTPGTGAERATVELVSLKDTTQRVVARRATDMTVHACR